MDGRASVLQLGYSIFVAQLDYYQILGVHRDASAHAIKAAYRHAAKMWHPDLNPQDVEGATEKLRLINEAYRVLSKLESRRAYDLDRQTVKRAAPTRSEKTAKIDIDEMVAELRKSAPREANRFEGKDAFLGMYLCFLFMMSNPQQSLLELRNIILLWPFLAGCLLAAHVVQRLSAVYFRFGLKDSEYSVLLLSHIFAAGVLAYLTDLLKVPLREQLWVAPILPALIAVLLPSAVGAGIGRAINRSLGLIAGLVGGGLAAALAALAAACFLVIAQIGYHGPEQVFAPQIEIYLKPVRAVLVASMLAGMLGSIRIRRIFIFDVIELMDTLMDRFRKI